MHKPKPYPWIDTQLRGVPVPEGLMYRLRTIALADDAALDDALRTIPVPPGLAGRLRLSAIEDDAGLDDLLRDVPVPYRVIRSLRSTPGYRLQLQRMANWVAAATLVVAIGLSYFGTAMGLLIATLPPPPEPRTELAWYVQGELVPDASDTTLGVVQLELPPEALQSHLPRLAWPAIDIAQPAFFANPGIASAGGPYRPDEFTLFVHRMPGGFDPLLDVVPYRWGAFGSHQQFTEPPGWQEANSIRPRGIPAPTAIGFDSSVLLRFGVFPFVPTAADETLRSVSVPLSIGTDSFELTRQSVAEGRLPPPELVRTEEFLAALDYGFPKPAGKAVRLSLFGGPSPFVPGAFLLQGGVQAAETVAPPRQPVHLILVVDASAGTRGDRRLAMLRHTMPDLCSRLGAADSLSLVAFERNAEVLAERAGAEHAKQLALALERVSRQAGANPGAGLTMAYSLANRPDEDSPAIQPLVVLLTDGLTDLPVGVAARIERRLAEAATSGIRLHVIATESAPDALNVPLESLVASGSGELWHVDDARQLSWALREVLTGHSQLVAESVRLSFRFDPKAVSFYRLLGHEPGAKTMDAASSLHSGEAGTVLFDVRLRQGLSANEAVATAVLSWREPGGGLREQETKVIRRGDLPANWIESPLPLQAALVAAETGELLRRNVYTQARPRPGTIPGLLELLDQVDSELWQNPSFNDFAAVVQRAAKARPHRGGATR